MSKVLIIAEAGVNHNGDLEIAKKLIKAAAVTGADLVKFQSFKTDSIATSLAPKAGYQLASTGEAEGQKNMLRRFELSRQTHVELMSHCRTLKIGFLSAAFDLESLDMLRELGLELFKVPSGEITNLPYLRRLGSFGKPVILSTGMADMEEIEAALSALAEAGLARDRITLLHCTTEYPAPLSAVNLRAMLTMGERFCAMTGYSDHTIGIEVPIAAVAIGARVIEKHLTLDRKLPGPDHQSSLEPGEFAAMVSAIRKVEKAMGDGGKRPSPGESRNKQVVRKSIVASRAISAGEPFTPENVTTKRPGTGISPMRWDEVMRCHAPRNFSIDELIEL